MYGLPQDFNGQVWTGRKLELICFGENSVYFHFERKLLITVMRSFSYVLSDDTQDPTPVDVPPQQSDVMGLLGHVVTSVTNEGSGTLKITFDNGSILRCYDPPEPYEAYHIEEDGKMMLLV
jgi:hypothetical protein